MMTCASCLAAQNGIDMGPCYCARLRVTPSRTPVIQFRLEGDAKQPTRAHQDDAGFDLYVNEERVVRPFELADVHTGLYIALPPGFWAHLLSRSSTPRRLGLHVEPAVIDGGYRGELFIAVRNMNAHSVTIAKHSRIAQIVPHRIDHVEWLVSDQLPDSNRGTGGFGSTGT